MVGWARTFERFRDQYRRDDGSKWSGAALERATAELGHRVSRDWVYKLAAGHIHDPSYMKIYMVSRAMGIPPAAWAEDDSRGDLNDDLKDGR